MEVPLTDRDSTIVAAEETIFTADCTQSSRWCIIRVFEFSTSSTSVAVSLDVEFNLLRRINLKSSWISIVRESSLEDKLILRLSLLRTEELDN